tara:strand:+ start:106 stop:1038 length:933 start_codon:yes stop_codon:yes gene_type:complete
LKHGTEWKGEITIEGKVDHLGSFFDDRRGGFCLSSPASSRGDASAKNFPAMACTSPQATVAAAVMVATVTKAAAAPSRRDEGAAKSIYKSIYKGVSGTASGKWLARIRYGKVQIHLGTFFDEQAAARAYDKEIIARSIDRIDRPLNFPAGEDSAAAADPHQDEGAAKSIYICVSKTANGKKWQARIRHGKKEIKLSNYRGVYRNKMNKKWIAKITVRGKDKYLGSFHDDKDAALAYDRAVIARTLNRTLNFPPPLGDVAALGSAFTSTSRSVPVSGLIPFCVCVWILGTNGTKILPCMHAFSAFVSYVEF